MQLCSRAACSIRPLQLQCLWRLSELQCSSIGKMVLPAETLLEPWNQRDCQQRFLLFWAKSPSLSFWSLITNWAHQNLPQNNGSIKASPFVLKLVIWTILVVIYDDQKKRNPSFSVKTLHNTHLTRIESSHLPIPTFYNTYSHYTDIHTILASKNGFISTHHHLDSRI